MLRHALAALLLILTVPTTSPAQEAPAPTTGDDLERRRETLPSVEPKLPRFEISGTLLGTMQWIANNDKGPQGSVFGAGSLDVNLVARPTDWMRLFLDAEGLIGPGPDQELGTLSRLHTDADRLEGKEKKIVVREAFVRLAFLEEHVRFSTGKLDVGHYFDRNFFAEDETTQFLDTALLNSPRLQPPPNGPGAAVRVSVGDWRYALGVHAPDDFDGDLSGLPYVIGELGRRNIFPLVGHYRWWTRVGSVPDDRGRVTWGTGLSIDQLVTPEIGVFVRTGLSRDQGDDLTSYAWSAGVQITPTWIGRGRDRFGFGYSVQRETAGREDVVETYYRLTLVERFSIVANVQWLLSGPNTTTGGSNRNVVVPGFRAVLLF